MADTVTAVNFLVRRACREVLGLAPGYFKPARQRRPAGTTAYDFATVSIINAELASVNVQRLNPDSHEIDGYAPDGAELVELVDPLTRFTASVNFYRSGATDTAGEPSQVAQTMSRATRLVQLLESSDSAERLRGYGLGYIMASKCRDLSALVDGNFEDRTQVDLDFYASDPVLISVTAFAEADLLIELQSSTGLLTATAEVTT